MSEETEQNQQRRTELHILHVDLKHTHQCMQLNGFGLIYSFPPSAAGTLLLVTFCAWYICLESASKCWTALWNGKSKRKCRTGCPLVLIESINNMTEPGFLFQISGSFTVDILFIQWLCNKAGIFTGCLRWRNSSLEGNFFPSRFDLYQDSQPASACFGVQLIKLKAFLLYLYYSV